MDGFTITLSRTGETTLTFSKAGYDSTTRIDEVLDKDLHIHKGGMGEGIAVVQDHLRNTHTFVLTIVFKTEPGVKSAWEKRRDVINAMQTVGKLWVLNFTNTEEGINESYNVTCKKVECRDLGGKPKQVEVVMSLIQSKELGS